MEELTQKFFGGNDAPPIINANEPHMACLFLVDVSGSMYGTPIEELNQGIDQFKQQVCEDERTRSILDVGIVCFNEETRVVQPFVPIEYLEPSHLTAGGGTCMGPAVELAVQMVDDRARLYRRAGAEPYKPWILMISDGMPGDDIGKAAELVRQKEQGGYLKFFSLGVEGYDSKTLHQLSGEKVMKLKGYDFSGFFDWVNKSMRSVSVSAPGEKPKGAPLPENVDKDTDDWM